MLNKIVQLLTLKRVVRLSRGLVLGWFMKQRGRGLSVGARVEFKQLGSLTTGQFATIGDDVVIGKNVTMGERTGIGRGTFIDRDVIIGARVSISRYVSIMTATHNHLGGKRRAGAMEFVGATVIGDGSWIGTHAIVLPQVRKIGAYAIVAAGAVVTKDVPDNCVVAGNPARVVKDLAPLRIE